MTENKIEITENREEKGNSLLLPFTIYTRQGEKFIKKYHIIRLYNEKYDFLIIATSYHNPLGYIKEINKKENNNYGT